MSSVLSSVAIRHERDVVLARQRARQIATLVGFDTQDQTRIAPAVSEIARNAFTYAHGGQVEFRVEGRTAPQVLVTTVSDRGPGIENLPLILEGRYHSSTGMGLGLIGARRLMDQFDIVSAPGRGTTVTLKRLIPRQTGLLGRELDGVRVLVLDDQPDAREAIAAALEGCGAQVSAVASVRDALETLARGATDVVVSDIAMPIEDGYRFIDRARSLPHGGGGDVPVVALTAHGGTPEESRIREAGFDAYLSKPIEPTELAASVARLAKRGTPT